MNFMSAYTLVDSIAVFLLVLFSLFLTQLRVGNRTSHIILAAFLLCLALSYMDGVFLSFGYLFHYTYAHTVYLTMSFDFLVGPLLYFYVLARTRPDFKWRPAHALHLLAFLAHFCFLFFRYHIKSIEEKRSLLEAKLVFTNAEILALTVLSNLHYLLYMGLVLYLLVNYQRAIKQYFSSIHQKNLNWLLIISCGILVGGLMRFSSNLLWLQIPHTPLLQYVDLKLLAVAAVLLFACVVVYKSLQQPEILRIPADFLLQGTEKIIDSPSLIAAQPAPKYKNTLLPDNKRQQYLARLNDLMRTEKPYLHAELTLAELSAMLAVAPHHLSQIINSEFGKNFYDFINGYRLQEALRMLRDPLCSDKYITQIMYDAGFNSKSVFNTVFKKEFGMTPSALRKSIGTVEVAAG